MVNPIHTIKSSFSGGEFAPSLWARVDIQKYASGARKLRNFIVHPHGGISNRPGTYKIAAAKNDNEKIRVVPFEFANDEAYVCEFGKEYIRFYYDGAQITTGSTIVEVTTPYKEADLADLRFAQSADVLFIVHPSYQPRELQRLSSSSWLFTTYDFVNGPFQLPNDSTTHTMQVLANTGNTTLVSSAAFFDSDMVGGLVSLTHDMEGQAQTVTNSTGAGILCGGTWRVISHGTWTGSFQVEKSTDSGSTWKLIRKFTSANDFNVDTYGTEDMSDGALPFLVRVNATVSGGSGSFDLSTDPFQAKGIAKLVTFISTTQVSVTMQRQTASTVVTSNWAEGAWSDHRGWPQTVTFSQDRLIFAGNYNQPQTIWMSQTGNYYDFFVNSPIVDSDSVNINLPSQKLNEINGMVSLLKLLVFSSGAEWSVGGDQSSVLSPTAITTRMNSQTGSSGIQPVVIVNRGIYVQNRGSVVRDLGYDLFTDTFSGANLSILSNHLFFNYNLVEMAYQQDPDSIVWVVRDDGVLLSMTYMREQEVLAWTWHDTYDGDDKFESVCTIPGTGYNEVWFSVNRDGQRYIERLEQRLKTTEVKDQFFVDSGITQDATGSTALEAYTKLLMHCDTSAFTDDKGKTITKVNSPFCDTAKKKFGLGSAYLSKSATVEIDYMEYATNALAQAQYVTNSTATETQSITNATAVNYAFLGRYATDILYYTAQSVIFTEAKTISAITLLLANDQESPTGDWTIRIETDNSGVPSGTLVDADATVTDTPPGWGEEKKYTFTNPCPVSGSTRYWIVVKCDDQAIDNYWRLSKTLGTGYPDGTIATYSSQTSTWSTSGSTDLYFKLFTMEYDLQAYSENVILTQGSYSLKAIAKATTSLNKTLTSTLGTAIDLSGINEISFDMYAGRTGENIKVSMVDSGGTITSIIPDILAINNWQTVTWDISGVADADKNDITTIIVEVVSATADNTFYIDNFKYGYTGSAYFTAPVSADFNFGTGAFTLEKLVYFDDITGDQVFFSQYKDADNYWTAYKDSNHKLRLVFRTAGSTVCDYIMSSPWNVLTGQWYQLEFTRNATDVFIFIDGVSQPLTINTAVSTNNMGTVNSAIAIGASMLGIDSCLAWIDEIRISKGIARHTTNYTPATSAYTIYGSGSFTAVTGLAHLEGREVTGVADGTVITPQTVSGSSITLPNPTDLAHVGLGYYSDLETLNIELGLADGTMQGRKSQIGRTIMRFDKSRGGYLGADFDHLLEILGDYKTSVTTSLYTGDVKHTLGAGYSDGGRFCYRQSDPLPVTILGVMPIVIPGGTTAL